MNLLQPLLQEAPLQPLSHPTHTQSETEPEKLLALYCSLSAAARADYFSSTTRLAEKFGVPQRTLQHWIDYGWIIALKIGRNYKVYTPSLKEHLRRGAEV